MKILISLIVAVFSSSSFSQQLGSTGKPQNWVQIGQIKDHIIQIDANSIFGFDGPLGLSHRADFRLVSKKNERLITNPKTAFMKQEDCDNQGGHITTFYVDSNGQATGKGDTHQFKLDGSAWPDYVGGALCRARRIVMGSNEALEMLGQNPDITKSSRDTAKTKEAKSNTQLKPMVEAKNDTNEAIILSEVEKRNFEGIKTMAFCAGFLKDVFPDGSQSHCSGEGIINKSKCDAFLVNNWYKDAMNPKNMPSPKFVEYVKQNKRILDNEVSRGWHASAKRHDFPKNWHDANNVCRNYVESMKQAIQKTR